MDIEPRELNEDQPRPIINTNQIPSTSSMNYSDSALLLNKDINQVLFFIYTYVVYLA